MNRNRDQRVAIAGLGAIGQELATVLDTGVPGCTLVALAESVMAEADVKVWMAASEATVVPKGWKLTTSALPFTVVL